MKYFIKIGERYLSYVDYHWYETAKECVTVFDSITSIKNVLSMLKKHYVYNPTIWEENENGEIKEIKLYKAPKPDPYFDTKKEPLKIKCTVKF